MAQVQMPDGTLVEMPDQLDPATAQRLRAYQMGYAQKNAAPKQPEEMGLGRQLLGNAELGGSAIANIPYGIAHAAHDLYNRVTGAAPPGDEGWEENIHVPQGAAGEELSQQLGNSLTGTIEKVADKPVTSAVGATHEYLTGEPTSHLQAVTQATVPAAADIAALTGARAPITNAIKSGVGALGESIASATGAGTPWKNAGFRTGGGHPIARNVASDSGQEALTLHNQAVGNTIGASEAGLPQGAQLGADALADARVEPSSVYNRAANALPTQELDAGTQSAIRDAANMEKTATLSDADQARVAGMANRAMTGPRSGQQVIEDIRTLRQEGFKRSASEDVDQQNIGKAQLGIARALEGYVGKALPENADVSLDQFQAARKALAKNWTVQEALHGSDIDMQSLARVARAEPELLDGGLKVMGDFANDAGRQVTSLPNRYNPPSPIRDLAGVVNVHRPVQSTIQGIPGVGSTARRFLTGDTAAAIDRAQQMFPGRPPGQFAPLNSAQLPGGRLVRPGETGDVGAQGTGTGANPNPSPTAPMGDLATVMSEGVPPSRSPGLSVGPMGSPGGQGLSFRPSPEVFGAQAVHGGAPPLAPRFMDDFGNEVNPNQEPRAQIPLGERLAQGAQPEDRPASVLAQRPTVPNPNAEPSLGDLLAELSDYAKVKSQGVPEGTAMRTNGPRARPSKPWLVGGDEPLPPENQEALLGDLGETQRPGAQHGPGEPLSNNASGQTDVSQEFANWQAERAGAGIRRVRLDPDAKPTPLNSTEARDPGSVKGRPVVDIGPRGEVNIIDRGGLTPSALNGLIARFKAGQLGEQF